MSDAAWEARAAFAGELARDAGALGWRYFIGELEFTAEAKGERQDWVSAADHAVEQQIRDALARRFPDDAMLGEEAGGAIGERLWVVDPIDGTLNFVHGMRYWCVSIAYVERGIRRAAAIYDPSLDELFTAAAGAGARCNGAAIRVSDCTSLDRALISQGYVHRHDLDAHLRLRRALLAAGAAVKDPGAGALMLAHVAAGRFDAFYEPHMHPWDALAGLLLIEEAGGIVGPYPGPQGIAAGGAVIGAAPGVYPSLSAIVDD
ncbi:MAG: inositol monophosphatase family protein [Casimicrobiaceae bacterium]